MTSDEQFDQQLERYGKAAAPGPSIVDDVMGRIERESVELESTVRHWRYQIIRSRTIKALIPAAVAAAILFVVGFWPQQPSVGVAWADVVSAMNRVQHFHATGWMDDPQCVDEARRMFKIEFYYKAPDQWRAEGLGHVHFVQGDNTRLYDAGQRKFVDQNSTRIRLIPDSFTEQFQRDGLFEAVISFLFFGQPPEGTPVKSEAVAETDGIEVFDYARDATRQWARIWVLKENQLPLRVKLYQPRFNGTMLVTFDYSDPQPASYFDPQHFEEVVKEKGLTKPHHILRAGSEPIASKPTSHSQVDEVIRETRRKHHQSKYQPAKIVDVAGNKEGAIAIVHTDPDNPPPEGGTILERRYRNPRDNWGNKYYHTGSSRSVDDVYHRFFMPVPPFKTGEDDRIVSLNYEIEISARDTSTGMIRDFTHTFNTEQRKIGFDSAEKIRSDRRDRFWSKEAQRRVIDEYTRETAPGLEQWTYLKQQFETRPDDVQLLWWAHDLLKEYGRADQAQAFVGEKILPLFLAEPIEHYHTLGSRVSIHLTWLYKQQGMDALQPVLDRLHEVQREAEEPIDGDPGTIRDWREKARQLFEDDRGRLHWLLSLPGAYETFESVPKPEVSEIVRSSDGLVVIRIALVKDPMKIGEKHLFNSWGPYETDEGWKRLAISSGSKKGVVSRLLSSSSNSNKEVLSLLLEPIGASPTTVTIRFSPTLLHDRHSQSPIRTKWSLTVDIPTEPTVESAERWWADNVSEKDWRPKKSDVFSDLSKRARAAYESGNYQAATQLYQQLLDVPKDKWPSNYFNPANARIDLYGMVRRDFSRSLFKSKARLGQLEQVLAQIAAMEAELPPLSDDLNTEEQINQLLQKRADLRGIRLDVVRYLMDEGQLSEASTMLDDIAKSRPEPMSIRILHKGNWSSYFIGPTIRRMWREFEVVRWDWAERIQAEH